MYYFWDGFEKRAELEENKTDWKDKLRAAAPVALGTAGGLAAIPAAGRGGMHGYIAHHIKKDGLKAMQALGESLGVPPHAEDIKTFKRMVPGFFRGFGQGAVEGIKSPVLSTKALLVNNLDSGVKLLEKEMPMLKEYFKPAGRTGLLSAAIAAPAVGYGIYRGAKALLHKKPDEKTDVPH